MVSKLLQLKHITDGGLRAEPQAAGGYGGYGGFAPIRLAIFCVFWKKISILLPFGLHFARFQSASKEQIFQIWESIEKISPFTLDQDQNSLKSCILGLNFVSDLA